MTNAKLINWTNEGYKLYAMKDGYITSFTMGTSESIEEEIQYKGTRNYDFWLVEKDGTVDFYTTKIDPMARGVGIEVTFEKTIKGYIVEDEVIENDSFGSIGGGKVSSFMNFKLIEEGKDYFTTEESYNEIIKEDDEVLTTDNFADYKYKEIINDYEIYGTNENSNQFLVIKETDDHSEWLEIYFFINVDLKIIKKLLSDKK